MPEYNWPEEGKRSLIGKRHSRLDGPEKTSGSAKYALDINRPGMLFGKVLRCPHGHARVTKLDTSQAKNMPGVKAVRVIQDVGSEIQFALDEIAVVAAETEDMARDAIRAIQVEYEVLSHFVMEEDIGSAPETKVADEEVTGDPDAAMESAEVTHEGNYGIFVISHCCLEPHGQVVEWDDPQNMTAWCSTQNVSGLPAQFAEQLNIPASNVRAIVDYMGGGFGSKFGADRWGIECAELAREAGAPVKLLLEREAEITVAGTRPSAFAEVKLGATRDGTLTAWQSKTWGSGGIAGRGAPPMPYILEIPNRGHQHTVVPTNRGAARAWRAPRHPQGCFLTFSAIDDLSAKLRMDPMELMLKNLSITGARSKEYEEELQKGAELIDWKQKWHARGDSGSGPIKQGLGFAMHTWGGRAHRSNCEVSIQPDGSTEVKIGTQDLGTGTRTVLAVVLAETFGLPLEAVKVTIGDSRLPASGASGGSTTVGGVSSSTRRASQNALEQLFAKVAPDLGVPPDQLEAVGGKVQVKGNSSRSLTWQQASARLGGTPITAAGANPGAGKLNDSGVGGVQFADVSVDIETGVVKMNKLVAVQDCGLIIDMKTAESQVYGAMIMGVAWAISEELIPDPVTGRILNGNMEFYKLPGVGDIGELVVHMMTGPGYDERGVIGLGEPPAIAPGAAIGNAVANAIGVRVPYLPLTPDRVLDALEKGGQA